MCMAPFCTTTEVILNDILNTLSIFYRWKVGSEEPKRPHNQETVGLGAALGLLIPRPRLLTSPCQRGRFVSKESGGDVRNCLT